MHLFFFLRPYLSVDLGIIKQHKSEMFSVIDWLVGGRAVN